MKMIIAIIRPSRLEAVKDSLSAIGVEGMTVSEVQGYGRQKGHTEIYRGAEYAISFVPKIKIETVVREAQMESAIEEIKKAAQTGKMGDGKIFVLPVEFAMRIRTEDSNEAAL
ncbi:nitrogen regulatory protein P-II 1 [Iodidimonas nitroreducens]|uniref:Nitrogen regulatory protein P-II n=1 Tax=Iodidimonas nitroreducens TaxID=1236968 RepID=A0A5A7N9S5_9PROT|nr:P-II family nitrogen regulator [Iodidimonas nitroreducens]GAK34137.1 nitrogen regulatory protein P-II [alpha proteobacterium Q-1]GER05121.1 nitrogen regulatory protein P-II 1 [Iodidimonas nitroreducens]